MPPTQFWARVVENRPLSSGPGRSSGYFVLDLKGDPAADAPLRGVVPGQFVMLRPSAWDRDLLNPRAFSVLDTDDDGGFSVLLKAYGRGTTRMQRMGLGERVVVTGPLGQGFSPPRPGGAVQLLVAGGVGLPPLYLQAKRAHAAGTSDRVEILYGGRDRADLVLLPELESWCARMHLATEDGSVGARGFVTVPLVERLEAAKAAGEAVEILACGPTPMLRAVRHVGLRHDVPTQLCLEEQMACGFGVCLGCAVPVHGEKPYRYCCTDGPVFDAREVRWS